MNNEFKNLSFIFGIVFAISFFLIGSSAQAYEKTITGNTSATNYYPGSTIDPAGLWVYNYQTFATSSPTVNNVSSFFLKMERETRASTSLTLVSWNLCQGKPVKSDVFITESGHWAENNAIGNSYFGCKYPGMDSVPLKSGSMYLKDLATTSAGQIIDFDYPVAIETGVYYMLEWRYFEQYNYPNSWAKEWYDTTATWPADQENFLCGYPCGNSMAFYYETTYTNYSLRWDTRPLPEGVPSISVPEKIICDLGAPCLYPVRYNSQAVGKYVYLWDYNNGSWIDSELYDTLQIQATTTGLNYLDVPATSTEQKIYYWIELQNREVFQAEVEYLATTTTFFPEFDGCGEEQVCADVATSSGAFFDDFRFGVECGFRQVICWAFVPTPPAQKYFYNSAGRLKTSFPFNTYFGLISIVDTALATSTNMDSTFGIPFIETPAQGGDFYIMPVISSSSMPNAIGQENTDLFRLTISYLIWIAVAVLIILAIGLW